MFGAKLASTPAGPKQKLSCTNSTSFDNPTLYRSTISAFQYVTITKLELAYIVNKLNQYL